jgi:hypothetical protein
MTREQALLKVSRSAAGVSPSLLTADGYHAELTVRSLEALGLLRLEEAGDKFSALIREALRDAPRDPSAMKPKATDHAGEHVGTAEVENAILSVIGTDLQGWTGDALAYAIYNGLRSRGMKVVRR